jgi:hypothetical protein
VVAEERVGFSRCFLARVEIEAEIVVAKWGNAAILVVVRAVFGLMEDCWRCGG